MPRLWFAKVSINADKRVRKGETEFRMVCDRCGTVRWLQMADLGAPHCVRGTFGYLLKRSKVPR